MKLVRISLHDEFGKYLTVNLLIMVCEPYATLGCGLVFLHAKFYGDTLNSWSFIISTIYYKFGPKM